MFSADNSSPPLYDYTTVNVTIIDINDHEPVFSPLDDTTDPATLIRLEVPENSTAPELIHVFAAFDLDSGENSRITYSIEGLCFLYYKIANNFGKCLNYLITMGYCVLFVNTTDFDFFNATYCVFMNQIQM